MRRMRVRINDQWHIVELGDFYQSPVEVTVDGQLYLVELEGAIDTGPPRPPRTSREHGMERPGLRGITQGNDSVIRCPLPGRVISISLTKGQQVEPGDEICVLESMKMEQSVRMAQRGIVKSVKVKRNQSINAGAPLVELQ